MAERPQTVLSCCVSLDGYLDDAGPRRLLLSSDADFDRVDELRARSDGILVGAGTIRTDDPRLLVRDAGRRARRQAAGRSANPVKVTLTGSGDLDPRSAFFTTGDEEKLVYAVSRIAGSGRLPSAATVVDAGPRIDLHWVVGDLLRRGVRTLMVEGGARVLNEFLTQGLADELQLVVAPFFVGDPHAPRFPGEGSFPHTPSRRARLLETRQVGDGALLRYALTDRWPGD